MDKPTNTSKNQAKKAELERLRRELLRKIVEREAQRRTAPDHERK